MQFEITYVAVGKAKRIVGASHFERSSAFQPVLRLKVGESAPPNRYRSAGYARIRRIA